MTEDFTATLSAFIDGEPIDADRFAAALEDPSARAALVDFVRMRAVVRAGDRPVPPRLASLARGRPVAGRWVKWPAVAALLILVFLAGFLTPHSWRPRTDSPGAAPTPSRIERFTPGVDWHQSN